MNMQNLQTRDKILFLLFLTLAPFLFLIVQVQLIITFEQALVCIQVQSTRRAKEGLHLLKCIWKPSAIVWQWFSFLSALLRQSAFLNNGQAQKSWLSLIYRKPWKTGQRLNLHANLCDKCTLSPHIFKKALVFLSIIGKRKYPLPFVTLVSGFVVHLRAFFLCLK